MDIILVIEEFILSGRIIPKKVLEVPFADEKNTSFSI